MSPLTELKNQKFDRKILKIATIALMIAITGSGITQYAHAQKNKIGKIFVTAGIGEDGFPDTLLENSADDLKNTIGKDKDLELIENEADADFMFTVVERKDTLVPGAPNMKHLTVNISTKDGDQWKPGTKITKNSQLSWGRVAGSIVTESKKWIKNQNK